MSFKVTRCVCMHRSFAEIVNYARIYKMETVQELRALNYCSTKCKMCEPYIERALETGETAFIPGDYANRKMSS